MEQHFDDGAISAKSNAFWHTINPALTVADLPNMVWVMLDKPEYARNGLGKMVAKTMKYHFTDTGTYVSEAMAVGTECSGAHIVYTQLNPVVVGTYDDVLDSNKPLAAKLRDHGFSPELVGLGVVKAGEFGWSEGDIDTLLEFMARYRFRASWLEDHPIEVKVANFVEADQGEGQPFDWPSIEAESV